MAGTSIKEAAVAASKNGKTFLMISGRSSKNFLTLSPLPVLGILILIFPAFLRYFVAIYLIVIGVLGLVH